MKKKGMLSPVFVAMMLCFLLLGFSIYHQNLSRRLEASTKRTLHEITAQQKFNIDLMIEAEGSALEDIAYTLSHFPQNRQTVLALLLQVQKNSSFDYLVVTAPDGKGILHDGRPIDISSYEYYPQLAAGETVLGKPVRSVIEDIEIIPLATPIIKDGEMVGILVASFTLQSFEELILPSFNGKSYSFVVDQQGEIIFGTHNDNTLLNHDNIVEEWEGFLFEPGYTAQQMIENIKQGKPGLLHYGVGDEMRFAEYMPLSHNNWSIIAVVPSNIIAPDSSEIADSTSILIISVISGFVLLILYILWQQRQNTKRLEKIAFYDEFTGAPTLAKFKMEGEIFIQDHQAPNLAMAKFDIEQFKLVNQILGDEVGDKVLQTFARVLEEGTAGKYKRYARLHDDEFLVLHQYHHLEELIEIRDRVLQRFYQRMGPDFQYEIRLVSGYYYMTAENCTNVAEAIEKANIAHRKAKQTGQEICIYDAGLLQQSLRRKEIETRMRSALANNEFEVYLQPKYLLETNEIVGAEALVRWVNIEGVMVPPGDFIPFFEQNGFITQLDFYMFEAVCKLMRQQIQRGWKPVAISINFSRLHLFDSDFIHTLCKISDQYEISHALLEIELTESVMFNQEELIQAVLEGLHAHGFILSMDDFGAGYSSLGLLKNLPVDIIKIDRSFFDDQHNKQRGRLIIESIMTLAKKLGIYTVAEGVEKQEHIDLLREIGCDIVQGYYFARPMPALKFFEAEETTI